MCSPSVARHWPWRWSASTCNCPPRACGRNSNTSCPAACPTRPPLPRPPIQRTDTMKTSTSLWLATAVLGTLTAVGYGAWTVGMNAGMSMATPQAAPAAHDGTTPSTQDPSAWTITQGFEATERHLRDGLKAGDVDPMTGLKILNYHDPMVPGKNFEAPGKSPFMDMLLVPRYAGGNAADTSGVSVSPCTLR
eukprot:Opistho-2@45874